MSWLHSSFYLFFTLILLAFSLFFLTLSIPIKRSVSLNFSVFSYLI